ncbi:MAG: hypothetical protein HBSAPP02_28700 [Phycisphaerae bacterium]|nr:MAG: hypothetical protein HBSAPP02_28700 [Phycisphaerae bacterium]
MATERSTLLRDGVPFLHEKQIEREAQVLLEEHAQAHSWQVTAPVPVDEIIELYLKLTFAIEDLQALLHVDDVLGAIWFTTKEIRVDVRLDPTANPLLLGRYRFTLAHEAGHWRLHRQYYLEDPNQGKLFDGRGQPAFVCRSSVRPPAERQADMFAGCLLMPREVLRAAWQAWRGNHDAVAVQQLPAVALHAEAKRNENVAMERFCRPLADQFEVSAEAMRIRLENLGLLLREVPNTLF